MEEDKTGEYLNGRYHKHSERITLKTYLKIFDFYPQGH
jgi:hypothetical protein